MDNVSENGGLLDPKAYQEFKSRSVRLKFSMQLFGAVGGATFFGLLTKAASILMAPGVSMAAVGVMLTPGVLIMAAVGVACVFMSCKFMYESNILDQDFQAKKIAAATGRGRDAQESQVAVAITETAEKEKPKPFPGITSAAANGAQVSAEETKNWSAQFARKDQPENWREKIHQPVAAEAQHVAGRA